MLQTFTNIHKHSQTFTINFSMISLVKIKFKHILAYLFYSTLRRRMTTTKATRALRVTS